MGITTVKYRITFLEECLGTASANPELYKQFIVAKRENQEIERARAMGVKPPPPGDEIDSLPPVEEEMERSMTVFSRDAQGRPILWDYQIRGFFKDACSALNRVKSGEAKDEDDLPAEEKGLKGTLSSNLKAFRKIIDGNIFVRPRQILLNLPSGGAVGICERPLRAQTAQGERIALARSETVPAGTWFDCQVLLLDPKHQRVVEEWLEYGQLRGLGQWRNSSKGQFYFERVK